MTFGQRERAMQRQLARHIAKCRERLEAMSDEEKLALAQNIENARRTLRGTQASQNDRTK